MARCSRCGKKGLFLKLKDGLCNDCHATLVIEQERTRILGDIQHLKEELSDLENLYSSIHDAAYAKGLEKAKSDEKELLERIGQLRQDECNAAAQLADTLEKQVKAEKNVASAERKVQKGLELVKSIQHACEKYDALDETGDIARLVSESANFLTPTVTVNLQCLDMKELRKRYRQNEKNIQAVLEKYKGRYTTKANITIYRLMVIALSAELQNVLHNIGYGKLDDALGNIRTITNKYYVIAADGNQNIAPTVKKFIGELDYYFQEAVKIEYEYYVQKERMREEQRAIHEQMRQEAEERRELERQQKQIEKEESKFHDQIGLLTEQLQQSVDDEKTRLLQERIDELQQQLNAVAQQREKISQLQNGKAGNVYIISNIGSFGEDVFKIGMTRRLDPMDRVNELGDASVPFPFDVHSFIFSDDAVGLENKLHHILNDRRVNKVNLRKEFFHVSLDDLEKLVDEIAPTADFKRTILAEQYRQSLSMSHVFDIVPSSEDDDTDDDGDL